MGLVLSEMNLCCIFVVKFTLYDAFLLVLNLTSFRFAGTEEIKLCKEHFSDKKNKNKKRLKASKVKSKRAQHAKKGRR